MESMRSDQTSIALPDGAGTILQIFRPTFASLNPEDDALVFYLRGHIAECIMRTQFQDAEFKSARERILRKADAARPLIGYREPAAYVAGLVEWGELSRGYDRNLYKEHRTLVDVHRARLRKEPTLVELVNGEFSLGLAMPGLAQMVSKGTLGADLRLVCLGKMDRAAFKEKYRVPVGQHLKALARLATYSPLTQVGGGAA